MQSSLGPMDCELILDQYLGIVPLRNFKWRDSEGLSPAEQKMLLEKILHHKKSLSYPPSIPYQISFLKHVISQAEGCGYEVEEELYVLLTDLLTRPKSSFSDFSFKSYNLGDGDYITLKESSNLVSHGTTGLTVWQASFYFVEWILQTTDLANKSVLELGCGLGFVGLVMCRLRAMRQYIFSDCHRHVLEKLEENITINLKGDGVAPHKVHCLDWREEGQIRELVASLDAELDYIIAADVVYDEGVIGHFVRTLGVFFSFYPHLQALVTSTIRNHDTYKFFRQELAKENLSLEVVKPCEESGLKQLFHYDRTQTIEIVRITPEKRT